MSYFKYYIMFIVFILLSCNSNDAVLEKTSMDDILVDNVSDFIIDTIHTIESETSFKDLNNSIIESKLQEYYDLLILKRSYPEFEKEIENQLSNIASFNDTLPKNIEKVVIGDIKIRKINALENNLIYKVSYKKNNDLDSVLLEISKTPLLINDNNVTSYKTFFKKISFHNK